MHVGAALAAATHAAVAANTSTTRTTQEIFTEEDQSESGSRESRIVSAAQLGLFSSEWEASLHMEAFLRPFFETKEAVEHKPYMTGAQSMMIMQNHIAKDCNLYSGLDILNFPETASVVDRERGHEHVPASGLKQIVISARAEASAQLKKRFFHERPSNTRMVLAAMSKQRKMDKWLSAAQCRLANTLYLQYLRIAVGIMNKFNSSKRLPTRSSPRKSTGGGKRKLMEDSDSDDNVATGEGSMGDVATEDPVVTEVRKWKDIQKKTIDKYKDDQGIVNEFRLMWDLKDAFPLHFIVFKRCASHLPHEANVEQISSGREACGPQHVRRTSDALHTDPFQQGCILPTCKGYPYAVFAQLRQSRPGGRSTGRSGEPSSPIGPDEP
jgi:hypothetical protein